MIFLMNWIIRIGTIESATADLMRFRKISPAIYNERRLYEQPVPEFIDETIPINNNAHIFESDLLIQNEQTNQSTLIEGNNDINIPGNTNFIGEMENEQVSQEEISHSNNDASNV